MPAASQRVGSRSVLSTRSELNFPAGNFPGQLTMRRDMHAGCRDLAFAADYHPAAHHGSRAGARSIVAQKDKKGSFSDTQGVELVTSFPMSLSM